MPDVVERCVEVDAPASDVWEAVIDPERLGEWLNVDVEMDVQPGGAARFIAPDGTRLLGLVEDVVPERRLAFCWWPSPGFGRTSRVEISLEETDAHTAVRVVETFLSVAPPKRPQLRVLASV
ncbi:MAG: hypothetical protein QOE35_3043 [Actinomycetota bacterium]|jgi:uncharacterized protein YndB with AHSA1/START domain